MKATLMCLFAAAAVVVADEMPSAWETVLGPEWVKIWDTLNDDGLVSAEEIIEACFRNSSMHDGDSQMIAALVLTISDPDPIPYLNKMMSEEASERRAFAVLTAGYLGDSRSEPVMKRLLDDNAKLVSSSGDWHWTTVADLAKFSMEQTSETIVEHLRGLGDIPLGEWLDHQSSKSEPDKGKQAPGVPPVQ